jgi:PAP2 superfamily protein
MLKLVLSWQAAAIVSGCLFAGVIAAGLLGARAARAAGPVREAATLLGLYALWQFAGSYPAASVAGAQARARWIWHTERVIHLPGEGALQRFFLPHPVLVQACNLYYASLHFAVLLACLAWLYTCHRSQYRTVRTTLVLFTAAALLVQLVPVAPPRLLPGDGMIDTAMRYGQSVYRPGAAFSPDQLSAMPSVHVGWALLIAIAVVYISGNRWRWLALLYPVLTSLVVTVTANHFWLDGLVAAVLLGLVLAAQRVILTARQVPRLATQS